MDAPSLPNPNVPFPLKNVADLTYIKPTITRPNIIVGEFSYYGGTNFESQVTHHYDFIGDKLVLGKFCQIARGVTFIMNGANHQMEGVSTFPFSIFPGWRQEFPALEALPLKGDTLVGNDVWIGEDATILPGVRIGNGAIIGAKSVVGSSVSPYTVVAGNPARVLRQRFHDALIDLLERLAWWDLPVEEIQELLPLLHSGDLEKVQRLLEDRLGE